MKQTDRWLVLALTIALLANVAVGLAEPRSASADGFYDMEFVIKRLVESCRVTGDVVMLSKENGQVQARIRC